MALIEDIVQQTETLKTWRQDLHQHPESAYNEHRTAANIAKLLRSFGIEVHEGIGRTGVVGVLQSGTSTRSIGLRADMDALLIQEANTFDHASTVPGTMHACGHDGHVAMLLGAARYLAQNRAFDGRVTFVFQPAEESQGGAPCMMDDGLFDRFPMDMIFGMHNWPDWPFGYFGVRKGPLMAATDFFQITIEGKGCHGAMPHNGVDPIQVAAQLISALQTIVSRNLNPTDAAVISVTKVHSGETWNALPSTAKMQGTIRFFEPAVQRLIRRRMETLVTKIAEGFGANASIEFTNGYPALINSAKAAELCVHAAIQVVGTERVRTEFPPTMGAEDFAFFIKDRPGCFVWLGTSTGPDQPGLHSPFFDFNDQALPYGASFWVNLVQNVLSVVKI